MRIEIDILSNDNLKLIIIFVLLLNGDPPPPSYGSPPIPRPVKKNKNTVAITPSVFPSLDPLSLH